MTYLFKKDNQTIADTVALCEGDAKYYDAILFHTHEKANILRWNELVDSIIIEFDGDPGEIVKQGEAIAHKFKPDRILTFDMQKMFDGGNDEHPTATIEALKMNCISYASNTKKMTAKMVVFDGFDNVDKLPEWITAV